MALRNDVPPRWLLGAAVVLLVFSLGFSLFVGVPKSTWEFIVFPLVGVLFCLLTSVHLMGWRASLGLFGLTLVLGWTVEELGVTTGRIFGPYHYTGLLGPKLGAVPLVIPMYWFMIIYISYVMVNLIVLGTPTSADRGPMERILLTVLSAFVATNYDLSFDPTMAHLQAWIWFGDNGQRLTATEDFFGVPPRNFYGWAATAFVIGWLFRRLSHKIGIRPVGIVSLTSAALPVLFYLSFWVSHGWSGYPEPIRPLAMVTLGIPALAALFSWRRWDLSGATAGVTARAEPGS